MADDSLLVAPLVAAKPIALILLQRANIAQSASHSIGASDVTSNIRLAMMVHIQFASRVAHRPKESFATAAMTVTRPGKVHRIRFALQRLLAKECRARRPERGDS